MLSNSAIIQPIHQAIISNQKSYWASHFYAVLQCLNSHTGLQYSPISLPIFPAWTLASLRGDQVSNFFEVIEPSMRNWGFQYFLVKFLNLRMAGYYVDQIIKKLGQLYNIEFSNEYCQYEFHMSGADSLLHHGLSSKFIEVFPPELNGNLPDRHSLIAQSDICLTLTHPSSGQKIGIFGEVEGNYGNKLKNQKFWKGKQDFCIINIGIVTSAQKRIYIEPVIVNGVQRINLIIGAKNYVYSDFLKTLAHYRYLFQFGRNYTSYQVDEEFGYFFDLLKKNVHTSVVELLELLRSHSNDRDILEKFPTSIPIITSIQSE